MRLTLISLVAFATQALAGPPYPYAKRADSSAASGTAPTTTKPTGTGSPQITPPVPASDVVTARYTLPPVPDACTDAFLPFQTTFWAKQNQMNMQDSAQGTWWGPKNATQWTFSTNTTGVYFSPPAWIESGNNPSLNFTHTRPNSFKMTMDETTAGQVLLFLIFNDNGTSPDPKVWNATEMRDMPEIDNTEDVVYQLTITGEMPCEHPIGNDTCASNKIDLNGDSWSAYGVDDWFEAWYDKRQAEFKDKGMMTLFGEDWKIGSDHTCTIDNDCSIVQSCKDLPDGGADKDSAQMFLVWQAWQNISDMLNRMYNNLNVAEGDTMTKIAQIALAYYQPVTAEPAPANPLLAISGIFGVLSAVGGLIPGAGPAVGAAFGAASGMAGAINSQRLSAPAPPDPQFAKSDADLGVVFGNYTRQMRTQLQDIHTGLFHDGVGMKELLRGGAYVDRTALNVDCSACIPKAQQWLEQMLTLKMINYMWMKQNVFVTYMPYGDVIQLDSMEQTKFTIDACYSDFLSGKNSQEDKSLTACMGGGMARLTYYNPKNASDSSPDPDGSVNLLGLPPGAGADNKFNSTEAVDVGFQPSWAAQSSAGGMIAHQQGYDVVADLSNSIAKGGDVSGYLKDLWNVNATTNGMFTLPTCTIRDLNYWPSFYGQGKNRRSYNDYCVCYNDLNDNIYGPNFKDYAMGDLQKFVSTWREGECGKGSGTEPAIGGSPVGLAPRASGHSDYVPLPWP